MNLEGILNNLSPWLQGAEGLKALRAAIQEKIAAKQAANEKELSRVDEMLSLDSGDRVNDLIPKPCFLSSLYECRAPFRSQVNL